MILFNARRTQQKFANIFLSLRINIFENKKSPVFKFDRDKNADLYY